MRRTQRLLAAQVSSGCADLVCQSLTKEEAEPLDLGRARAFALTGFLVTGPLGYGLMVAAERLAPGATIPAVVKKMAGIQCVEPLRLGSVFFANELIKGGSPAAARKKVESSVIPAWQRSAFFWPPVLWVMLRHLPLQLRIPFSSLAGGLWNTYMSWEAAQKR